MPHAEKLFISYPSESWNFAQRIAEGITRHLAETVFIDYKSINDADFERADIRRGDGYAYGLRKIVMRLVRTLQRSALMGIVYADLPHSLTTSNNCDQLDDY